MSRIQRILQKNTERQYPKQSLWSAVCLAFVLISAVLITILWTGSSANVNAQSKTKDKKIAVGFVSIPPVDRMSDPPKDADATMRLLIAGRRAKSRQSVSCRAR